MAITKLQKSKHGAVLIELALALPTFLILLYFIMDAPRITRIKTSVNQAGVYAVSMMQNLAITRLSSPTITKIDFKNIICAAFLSVFKDGKNQYAPYPLSYSGYAILYCIRGLPSGQCQILWSMHSELFGSPPDNKILPTIYTEGTNHISSSIIKTSIGPAVDPKAINSDLKIEEGKIKMLLDISLYDTNPAISNRKKFSLHLGSINKMTDNTFLNHVLIFAPFGDGFSSTPPL